MFEEVLLPNGQMATTASELDAYLKENEIALSGDYSRTYLKNVRRKIEADQKREAFEDFVNEYKKRIWNE